MDPVLAIDFGTSKCCAIGICNEREELILNENGRPATASFVTYEETQKLVGDSSKSLWKKKPWETIYGMKRLLKTSLIGMADKFRNLELPFLILDEKFDFYHIGIEGDEYILEFQPEEVITIILTEMRILANKQMDCQFRNAVISVPAIFNSFKLIIFRSARSTCYI